MAPDSEQTIGLPDTTVSVKKAFGLDTKMTVPAFSTREEHVPDLDPAYVFDPDTTLAILAGFGHNRRVMIQGYHGTGKSTHIEQVAARLNWPCLRVNLDSHISRIDLIGKDAIVLREGFRLQNSARAFCPGRCKTRLPLFLMSMMPDGPMSCLSFNAFWKWRGDLRCSTKTK